MLKGDEEVYLWAWSGALAGIRPASSNPFTAPTNILVRAAEVTGTLASASAWGWGCLGLWVVGSALGTALLAAPAKQTLACIIVKSRDWMLKCDE